MKRKIPTLNLCIALVVFGFISASCNSEEYTPPEVVGTWEIGTMYQGSNVKALVDFNNETYNYLRSQEIIDYYGNMHLPEEYDGLDAKLKGAFHATLLYLEDLKTITLTEEGTFSITSQSFNLNASGKYTQDGQYIIFECTSDHFQENNGQLIAATDGQLMVLYPSSYIIAPIFTQYLEREEKIFLFGNANPTNILFGEVYFTRTGVR